MRAAARGVASGLRPHARNPAVSIHHQFTVFHRHTHPATRSIPIFFGTAISPSQNPARRPRARAREAWRAGRGHRFCCRAPRFPPLGVRDAVLGLCCRPPAPRRQNHWRMHTHMHKNAGAYDCILTSKRASVQIHGILRTLFLMLELCLTNQIRTTPTSSVPKIPNLALEYNNTLDIILYLDSLCYSISHLVLDYLL